MQPGYSAQPEALPASQTEEATRVMVAALADTPAYAALVPGRRDWRRFVLTQLLSVNVCAIMAVLPDAVRCVRDEHGSILAVYVLVPTSNRPSDWALIRTGLFRILWKVGVWEGLKLFWRLNRTFVWTTDHGQRAWVGGRPVMVLERLAVRPDCQGCGIGRHCLEQALQTAKKRGTVLRLCTQEERVVTLYERAGFTVNAQFRFKADREEYSWTGWFMEHPCES